MNRIRGYGWLVALGLGLAPAVSVADLERRVDDSGVIHYRNLHAPASPSSTPPAKAVGKPAALRPSALAKQERKAAQQRRSEQERAQARQEKHCARLRKQLDGIQRKLDAGYREPKGNALRRQRRELQAQLFRECR